MKKTVSNLKIKILDSQDKFAWNRFVDKSPWGDLLQLWEWGELKRDQGWKPLRIGIIKDKFLIFTAQILLKKVPFLGSYGHIPHGPVFHSIEDLKVGLPIFVEYLGHLSKTYDFLTIETEPKIGRFAEVVNSRQEKESKNLDKYDNQQLNKFGAINNFANSEIFKIFAENGFIQTKKNIEPIHKLYYNLELTEEDLLAQANKSTRYNIRLASKKGVEVKEYFPDNPEIGLKLKTFYDLILETQKRAKGYPIRPFETYKRLFELFKNSQQIVLYEAVFKGETIAMNISQRTKFWSSSFYAGSNRKYPKVKASYALRWNSIVKAKKYGSKTYDFWGIVPSKGHGGYSDHKLGFGGVRVDTEGLLALKINPIKFAIWDNLVWARTHGKSEIRKIIWKAKDLLEMFLKKSLQIIRITFQSGQNFAKKTYKDFGSKPPKKASEIIAQPNILKNEVDNPKAPFRIVLKDLKKEKSKDEISLEKKSIFNDYSSENLLDHKEEREIMKS